MKCDKATKVYRKSGEAKPEGNFIDDPYVKG
jgi:hypothetical protein